MTIEHLHEEIQQLHKRVENLEEWMMARQNIELRKIYNDIINIKIALASIYDGGNRENILHSDSANPKRH